jgi:hypothetical protein
MACEQLLDEISIKVMLEKDPVGWKAYSPLTDEERMLYNAMVSPLLTLTLLSLMCLSRLV